MLKNIKTGFLALTIFLFPLFFLTTTQDPFTTNKLYFLAAASLVLIFISTLEFITSKKIVWEKKTYDYPILAFIIAIIISIVLTSPNKISALLNVNLGLIKILPLAVIYYYLSRNKSQLVHKAFYFSAVVVSLISLVFVFQPLKNVNLPPSLQILKIANFTPLSNYLELAIYLGFMIVWEISQIINKKRDENNKNVSKFSFLVINIIAFGVAVFLLVSPLKNQQSIFNILFYPFRIAWYAAVEIIKNPLSAFFGVGVDNFSAIFTRVKDVGYNQSGFWQMNYFTISRSLLLHVFTETGLLGLATFLWPIILVFKKTKTKQSPLFLLTIYCIVIAIFLPPALTSIYIIFMLFGLAGQEEHNTNPHVTDLKSEIPLILILSILSCAFLGAGGYFVGRAYSAELYYQKSASGVTLNNMNIVYDNLKNALIINPYSERYATDFSLVNLQYAMNLIASKNEKKEKLTDQERTSITQAIQQAILEAKRVVELNPNKAANWENLAIVYKNIINIAQDADVWTVSAYQRAIVADPQNPIYRINLGGVYYSLNNYEEATKLFEQAISLKPDWANAYYNVAWSNYQQNNLSKAVNAMENTIKLLDPNKDKSDLERAKADLDTFNKKLKANEEAQQATKEATPKSSLDLPKKSDGIDPKLDIKNQ